MSVSVKPRGTVWALFKFSIRAKTATARQAELKRLRGDAMKLARKYRGTVRINARRIGGYLFGP